MSLKLPLRLENNSTQIIDAGGRIIAGLFLFPDEAAALVALANAAQAAIDLHAAPARSEPAPLTPYQRMVAGTANAAAPSPSTDAEALAAAREALTADKTHIDTLTVFGHALLRLKKMNETQYGQILGYLDELDALRARLATLEPVVEAARKAAKLWRLELGHGCSDPGNCVACDLVAAVDALRAGQ